MSNGVHLVMPMGGSGSRFSGKGFELPKPLLRIQGKPFLFWSTQSVRKFVELKSLTFVVLKEHVQKFKIDTEIHRYFPEASIIILDHVLNGAVLTCMAGIEEISDDSPVLFNDCDHIFTCRTFYDYCRKGDFSDIDGALLTFQSDDPKFSFLEINGGGNVLRTVEKIVVSNQAICGAYFFRNKCLFENAVKDYLKTCTYKEFFVSGVYNVLAEKRAIIRAFEVEMHLPFGTPEEYDVAVNSKEFIKLL